MVETREVIAGWIAEQRREQNAPALAWCVERAVEGLIACYPEGQGVELVWALVRRVVAREEGQP